MRLAIVFVLAACGAVPARSKSCTDAWVVVRARQHCGDLRGGISGYWVFEIVDGPRRGALLIGRYHDGPSDHGVGYGGSNWGVARASFGETSGASGWDNSCHEMGPTPVYAGTVDDFQGFDHESDARRAWAAKPCEAKRVTPAVGDG